MSGVGCASRDLSTDPFGVTHTSRIVGRVTDSRGTPLDSVQIFVRIPQRAQFGYATAPVLTNALGEFRYDVQRMLAPAVVPETDTVTVDVSAQVQKQAYRNADGSYPVVEAKALLTFVAAGEVPRTTRTDLRVLVAR